MDGNQGNWRVLAPFFDDGAVEIAEKIREEYDLLISELAERESKLSGVCFDEDDRLGTITIHYECIAEPMAWSPLMRFTFSARGNSISLEKRLELPNAYGKIEEGDISARRIKDTITGAKYYNYPRGRGYSLNPFTERIADDSIWVRLCDQLAEAA